MNKFCIAPTVICIDMTAALALVRRGVYAAHTVTVQPPPSQDTPGGEPWFPCDVPLTVTSEVR